MTPKEKAKKLVDKFYNPIDYNLVGLFSIKNTVAKQCALIAVDEILKLRKGYFDCTNPMQDEKHWQEVKSEIENL